MSTKTPANSKMTLPPGSPKLRKLAVYGRRASGKTCILTSLAMARLPNPRGYSCLWISDHGNCPDISTTEGRAPDDPLLARHRGKEMLTNQIKRLDGGKLPEATELRHPLQLIYQFTRAETFIGAGTQSNASRPDPSMVSEPWAAAATSFFAELIDYSGELIDADNDTTFAETLAAHLEQCDGLLILAEATTTEEQNERLHKDLEQLRNVLPAVTQRREKQKAGPFPIALLLNKWDRMVDCEQLTPLLMQAARQDLPEEKRHQALHLVSKELNDSLNTLWEQMPPAPQLGLKTVLQALAGGEEYFRTFCVSALGACRTESTAEGATREVPVAKRPLLSFGLEDPFIWLAQRGDSLRLARLQSHATNLQPWYLHLLCSGLPKRLYREHTRLSALYPESHPFNARLRTIRRPLLKVFASASAIAASMAGILLMLSIMASVAVRDSIQWRRFGPLLDKAEQNLSSEQLQAAIVPAEDYVGGYVYPKWYRTLSYLLVQPRAQAAQYHGALKTKLSDLHQEQQLLTLLGEWRTDAAQAQDYLPRLETLLKSVRELAIPSQFLRALAVRTEAQSEIETLVMKGKYGIDYLEEQKQLDHLLTVGDVVQASRIIINCSDTTWKDQLKARFQERGPRVMSEQVRKFVNATDPDLAGAEVAISNYRSNLLEVLPTEQLEMLCARWENYVKEYSEYFYYSRCVADQQNRSTLNTFLEKVHNDGPRAQLVKARIDYLDWLVQPRDWNVEARVVVNYHSGSLANNPDVTTYLGTPELALTSSKVEDLESGTEISGLSGQIPNLRPDEEAKIIVSFLVEYGVFGTYQNNLGQYVCQEKLCDQAEAGATRLSLTGGDPDAATNVVELTVKPVIDAGIPLVRLDPAGAPPELDDEEMLK